MRKSFAKRQLKAFSDRYDYDVTYMEHMLDVSPDAFFKFAGLTELAQHREAAPTEAFYAAKLVGALAEDCGPCVQLVVDMAREAGLSPGSIEGVLTRNFAKMDVDTALGFRFAEALVGRTPDLDDARDVVRAQWGEAAVIDLTLGTQIGRVFPMVKAGLGFAKSCQRVQIDDHPVDVVKEAA
ncbi:MAG: hypothetical protein QNJ94_11195 [Alphaproteobacteria bacterium]|nr:hypothetical protein [Alphaproteobacteria bacterium]